MEKTTNSKPSFGAIVADHRAEFKKIVWPSKDETVKKTFTVVVVSLVMSVIIFGYDTIFTSCTDLVMKLLGLI